MTAAAPVIGRRRDVAGDRIRLLEFLTAFPIGGTERQVVNLMRTLDRDRFDLRVGCLHRAGEFLDDVLALDVPVADYPVRSFRRPATLRWLLRFAGDLRRARVDVMHSHNFYSNVFAIPAARLAGTPVVIASIRDLGPYLTPWQRRLQAAVVRLADAIVVNADAIRRWLVAQGLDPRRITVIPNGIDVRQFAVGERRPGLRAELGLPASARLVVLVARLNPLKGFDDFFAAAAEVARRAPGTWFVVVGDSGSDPTYRDRLRTLIGQLGLADRVVFTGFRLDVPRILAEATVSVLPSLSEGLSNTVLESMSAGVPIIATDVGGTREVIEPDVTGLLVPARDPSALAAALTGLLADPARARALGQAARARVLAEFGLERMIATTETLYVDLLARRRPGHPGALGRSGRPAGRPEARPA